MMNVIDILTRSGRTFNLIIFQQVSWVRRRDWHILSSGLFTYTNDERFQILHAEGSDDWTLQIKYVQKRDNGTYECQVSSTVFSFSQFGRFIVRFYKGGMTWIRKALNLVWSSLQRDCFMLLRRNVLKLY